MANNLEGKTCLVTGASGFMGANLCNELVKQGARIKALLHVDLQGCWDEKVVCNLGEDDVPESIMQDVDIVFHLAGLAHSLTNNSSKDYLYYKINVDGTKALLDAAKLADVKRFIFFSSVKAMCEENNNCLNESFIPKPVTAYGMSKLEAEKLVLNGGYVIDPTVLRLVMVYGNTNKGNLPRMINFVSKRWFLPFPKTLNKRSMIHVDDVIDGAILAATNQSSGGEVYILSDGVYYSTREIYELICKSLNKEIPPWCIPVFVYVLIAKFGGVLNDIIGKRIFFDTDNLQKLVGNSFFSSEKAMSELGFAPVRSLSNSIANILIKKKPNG